MNIRRYVTLALALFLAVGIQAQKGAKGQKSQKRETAEYIAKRETTRQVLDSIIRHDKDLRVTPDKLEAFVDEKCKEFKDDPWLQSKMAMDLSFFGGYQYMSEKRFPELRKKYPQYLEGYIDNVYWLLQEALREGKVRGDVEEVVRAKAILDSAKLVDPTSMRPYEYWIKQRAPYIATEGLEDEIKVEVEAWNKVFPDSLVYLKAARILLKTSIDDIQNEELKNRFNARTLTDLANSYFEIVGYDHLSAQELVDMSGDYFLHGNLDKGAEIAELGMSKGEEANAFHRLALRNNALAIRKSKGQEPGIYLQKAQDALTWMKENSTTFDYNDYIYAGLTCQEAKDYSQAIDYYNKALSSPHGFIDRKNTGFFMNDSLNIMKNMAACYAGQKDYEMFVRLQKEVIEMAEESSGKFSLSDWNDLADGYSQMANDSTLMDYEKFQALITADSIYASLQREIDNGYEISLSRCYFLNRQFRRRQQMDIIEPNQTIRPSREIAEAIYMRLEDDIDILDSNELTYMLNASVRLCNIFINSKDYKKAAVYAETILKIKPDHNNASSYQTLVTNYGKSHRKRH